MTKAKTIKVGDMFIFDGDRIWLFASPEDFLAMNLLRDNIAILKMHRCSWKIGSKILPTGNIEFLGNIYETI